VTEKIREFLACVRWDQRHTATSVMDNCALCGIGVWVSEDGVACIQRRGMQVACMSCAAEFSSEIRTDPIMTAAQIELMGKTAYDNSMRQVERLFKARRN
jgi:hypothetical protein